MPIKSEFRRQAEAALAAIIEPINAHRQEQAG